MLMTPYMPLPAAIAPLRRCKIGAAPMRYAMMSFVMMMPRRLRHAVTRHTPLR